ncbi:MAG: hypothetical protein LBV70_06295, partial [Candidatus Adiutrix sp.]|nr:hypothetical protein [Candidatus Adiutrix sp.]
MTPEDWQAYQNQAPAPRPRERRGGMNWPMAMLLMGLAVVGGCVYTCGHLVDSLDFQPVRASEPSVGVLVLEEEIIGSLWATEALGRFQEGDNIKSVVLRINSPGGAVAPCQE